MTRAVEAVVTDMDGVLTRTAVVHERAWKQVFDEFLAAYGRRTGTPQAPFSTHDYRAFVDGKPRYDGAADLLAARGVALERGAPTDPPSAETVCGIGNRKQRLWLELLEREGPEVYADAVAALERWRRGGLKLAVVSASRNSARVLAAVGLDAHVDVLVDGNMAADKRGLMAEALRSLGVEAGAAVVIEDAQVGVRAGRELGFGLVVGVDRGDREGHGEALRAAGAERVVDNLAGLRFLRRIPPALARRGEITSWQRGRPLAVFLDFDGTLAPIVADPGAARLPDATRTTVAALAARCPVAIVSGRDRLDVEARVGLDGLVYAGGHGFDIAGQGYAKILPEAEQAVPAVAHAEQELRRALASIPGAIIERKRFSVAAHYRQVEDQADIDRVQASVAALARATGLRARTGKMVVELEPALEWDKGRAVEWILSVLQIDRASQPLIYIGDDETDEDVFAVIGRDGLGVRVGAEYTTSLADYRLADPDEVAELLAWLVEG